ncbi:MAG: hypothetical protein P1U56_17030 [Saprospiraceae bacterium]|nr:hypothetical protein [Saprospiraceae bacterium]
MKALNEMLIAFFDDDNRANSFYTSNEFTKLKELYQQEFKLELIRTKHNQMEVVGRGFYIPTQATDEQIVEIQTLLNVHFFTIQSVPVEQQTEPNKIDWDARYAMLFSNTTTQNKTENEVELKMEKETLDNSESLKKKIYHNYNTAQRESMKKQRPWWKFW